jgi:hypothetical protein
MRKRSACPAVYGCFFAMKSRQFGHTRFALCEVVDIISRSLCDGSKRQGDDCKDMPGNNCFILRVITRTACVVP